MKAGEVKQMEKTTRYQFNHCLTNGMDYFVACDPHALLNFAKRNRLRDDLLMEFTTNESGDVVIYEGIMIPLSGVEIVPHTIYVNLNPGQPELMKPTNDLQFEEGTYPLKIENGILCVFSIDYLRDFTQEKVYSLINTQKTLEYPLVALENGWYSLNILAGLTRQNYPKSAYHWGQIMDDMEPTFEFCLEKTGEKPSLTANVSRSFRIEINKDEYRERRAFK